MTGADRQHYALQTIFSFFLGLMVLARRFVVPARSALAVVAAGAVLGAGLFAATRARLPVWSDSELLWRDTLRHAPDAAVAHGNLGEVLAARGADEEALDHYRRALELRPDYLEARVNMANALARLGRTAAAESVYATALSRAPANAQTYVNLGIVRRQGGDLAGARAALEAALEINPRHGRARQLVAIAAERGDEESALAYLDRAIAVDPAMPSPRTAPGPRPPGRRPGPLVDARSRSADTPPTSTRIVFPPFMTVRARRACAPFVRPGLAPAPLPGMIGRGHHDNIFRESGEILRVEAIEIDAGGAITHVTAVQAAA
jgi:tetratricopeptide (TPR) repeat protein